jgi:hypothetical protein
MKPCKDCQKLHEAPADVEPMLGRLIMQGREVQPTAHYTCTICNATLIREMGDKWRLLEMVED